MPPKQMGIKHHSISESNNHPYKHTAGLRPLEIRKEQPMQSMHKQTPNHEGMLKHNMNVARAP
jgi:hypothetical protein